MNEKQAKIMIRLLVGIAALLVINFISTRRIARLEAQLNHLDGSISIVNSNISSIQSNLWGLSSRISEVSEQIVQGAKLSFDETVMIRAYHSFTASADVEVTFFLREYTPGDTISVTARGQNGEVLSAYASRADSGRFTAMLTLPVHDNYVFTFTATGATITTGELTQYNLADRLCRRFSFWLSQSHSFGANQPTTISLHPSFRNYTQGNPALEVTSLTLFIETEAGETIVIRDLADYLLDIGDMQMLDLPWGQWGQFLSFTVGDELGNIPPDETVITRLVIRDNLGVRYEHKDILFFPGQLGQSARAGATDFAQAVMPVPTFPQSSGTAWGVIRIVE